LSATYTPHHSSYLAHRIMLDGYSEDAFARNMTISATLTEDHER